MLQYPYIHVQPKPCFFLLLAKYDIIPSWFSIYGHPDRHATAVSVTYVTHPATCSYMLTPGKAVILVADVNFSQMLAHIPAGTCLVV